MSDADELLTVAQAAALIGVSERTLYRLLKSGNNAARTLTEQRQTVTGRRQTTLVPRDLADELRDLHGYPAPESRAKSDTDNDAANAAKNGDNDAASTPADGDATVPDVDTDAVQGRGEKVALGSVPAEVYQHRIADLEAQNAELRADKARLYDLLQLAQENLKREQSLRLLTVEHAEPLEGTEWSATQDASADAPPEQASSGTKTPKFWARLWGRKEQGK